MVADKTVTLMERQRKVLLGRGYTEGQASLAISWAKNSAEGMSNLHGIPAEQFIRGYLRKSEEWLRGCGIIPGQFDADPPPPEGGG